MDLTFDALGFPMHLDPFRRLFDAYPKMRTVIDHCMKPVIREDQFEPWATQDGGYRQAHACFLQAFRHRHRGAPGLDHGNSEALCAARHFVFGADRVMWGSDWPVLELNGSYPSWHDAAQAIVGQGEDNAQIFGKTAAKFYRIDEK